MRIKKEESQVLVLVQKGQKSGFFPLPPYTGASLLNWQLATMWFYWKLGGACKRKTERELLSETLEIGENAKWDDWEKDLKI